MDIIVCILPMIQNFSECLKLKEDSGCSKAISHIKGRNRIHETNKNKLIKITKIRFIIPKIPDNNRVFTETGLISKQLLNGRYLHPNDGVYEEKHSNEETDVRKSLLEERKANTTD